jgi:hypothetical protein
MSGLLWKLSRLRVMKASEMCYRLRQICQAQWEKRGLGLARPMEPEARYGKPWVGELPRLFDRVTYQDAADRIVAGRFDVFALKNVNLGFPPQWNIDPKTSTEAPMSFGKALNYRDERLVGDIKYLWEPNRHLELVTLAQAFHLTGEPRYAEGARRLLDSWFTAAPYPLGINWISSLEHAVRLANWSVAWQLLGGEASPLFAGESGQRFLRRWLDSIHQHCHFIAGHLSRHSSANNHLFGEYMGLFVATSTWRCWPHSSRWRELGRQGLEREALLQNAEDGVNREQAIWYHHEVADMMLLCALAARANGADFSAAYWQRFEAMLDFIAALMDAQGHLPMIGDADDAVMVRFTRQSDFCVYRSLLATGAVLCGRADFARKAGRFDDKSRWLLGDGAQVRFSELLDSASALPASTGRRDFAQGGYWVLGCDAGSAQEIHLVADAGPLGYLSIAAHGHADALAMTLSLGGHEFLIDPGTYAYHSHQAWRDYFRGTAAHNTVRVDHCDQSLIAGNFMWLKHARAQCEQWQPGQARDLWVGVHEGYRRLSDPLTHRRQILLDKCERTIEVTDQLLCQKSHFVELHWHFAEHCQVTVEDGRVIAFNGGPRLQMSMPGTDWQPRLVRGSESPPLGWISRGFDYKQPITTVVWSGMIEGDTKLATRMVVN